MAHKVLVNGTAYEVKSGKTLVNGTVYDIEVGKTLVGGTPYEIKVDTDIVLTITGSGATGCCYVTYNGKTYTGAATLVVTAGTKIYCACDSYDGTTRIYKNNVLMASNVGVAVAYTYIIPGTVSGIRIQLSGRYGYTGNDFIYITETY